MVGKESQDNGAMNVEQLQDTALNLTEFVCGVLSQPVEILLRPRFGTRYFPVPVTALATVLMIMLPLVSAMFMGAAHMIPFVSIPAPRGMIGFAAFTKLYLAVTAIHSYRLWMRILHMEREFSSTYEGPALPFFKAIPWLRSFWKIRIFAEPIFVFLAATVLTDFYIVQSSLGSYLKVAAFAIAGKSFVGFFRQWQYMRVQLDMRNAGPTLARLIEDQATEEELNQINLASFPKNVDPEIRKATAVHIARTYTAHN